MNFFTIVISYIETSNLRAFNLKKVPLNVYSRWKKINYHQVGWFWVEFNLRSLKNAIWWYCRIHGSRAISKEAQHMCNWHMEFGRRNLWNFSWQDPLWTSSNLIKKLKKTRGSLKKYNHSQICTSLVIHKRRSKGFIATNLLNWRWE